MSNEFSREVEHLHLVILQMLLSKVTYNWRIPDLFIFRIKIFFHVTTLFRAL